MVKFTTPQMVQVEINKTARLIVKELKRDLSEERARSWFLASSLDFAQSMSFSKTEQIGAYRDTVRILICENNQLRDELLKTKEG